MTRNALVTWLKALDPSRLVDDASGWTDKRVGDLIDMHSYPGPECPQPECIARRCWANLAALVWACPVIPGRNRFWGYLPMTERRQPERRVTASCWTGFMSCAIPSGLSAAVYTQTTDVETECNGLLTYDRAVAKLDPAVLQAANHGANQETPLHVIAAQRAL